MNRYFWALCVLCYTSVVFSQKAEVYTQIPSQNIQISASSSYQKFPAIAVIDGSGMTGDNHVSHNSGNSMWISEISTQKMRANEHTPEGVVWLMLELNDKARPVDFIRIWNHNQNQHTKRGLRKVYLTYSEDGKMWKTIDNGEKKYHILNESKGRALEPADFSLRTNELKIKYLCITADLNEGNHYHDNNPLTLQESVDLNQDINYYGLSEIRLYHKENRPLTSLNKITKMDFVASQGYLKTSAGSSREYVVKFDSPLYTGGQLLFECRGKQWTKTVMPDPIGIYSVDGLFPPGYMEENADVSIHLQSKQASLDKKINIPGARKWTLYFLPHSHQDIGYTHRQDDVMKLQWRNLDRAIELSKQTADYPEGSRFKWNSEATWSVKGYLDEYKGTEKEKEFVQAIQKGVVGIDASLGSILTGICKQEELMHVFDDAHLISRQTGVEFNTAMTSDLPGQSWGYVTALAQNGIKYYSPAPNYVPFWGKTGCDRAAIFHVKWGDVPFYWQSQSGTDKVLYWQTGKGYSWFHGWLLGKLSSSGIEPMWEYLAELEAKEYPYATSYLRYTVNGDNGPPDPEMPNIIRDWNEKYEYPRFIIGTTKELFESFEKEYGQYLPVFSGDMTPVWEDGAASTARELGINRAGAERLNQSEILWSMVNPHTFPANEFLNAWKHVVLFSEHTWGASASGPDPVSQFTKDLWQGKKMYGDSADIQSRRLFNESFKPFQASRGQEKYIQVFNTNLWVRTDVVTIEKAIDLNNKILKSPSGELVPLQKLNDGRWIFVAKEIAPLSSTAYKIVEDKRKEPVNNSMIRENTLNNGIVKLEIDPKTGVISSFSSGDTSFNYVGKDGLNNYIYSGRMLADMQTVDQIDRIAVLNDGEVAATLRVESSAPGCRSLWRDITIYKSIGRVDITNTLDKLNIYKKENVRFAFPFNISDAEITMDMAMGEVHPEREQLTGSNKNFYSILNGLAVNNLNHGIYLTTIDAPFIELGEMTAENWKKKSKGEGWMSSAIISPTVYSWIMNNAWGTNYKASQDGQVTFNYSVEAFDPYKIELKRQGMEQAQKLVCVVSDKIDTVRPLFRLKGNNQIAISTIRPSEDGTGYIIRLQNISGNSVNSSFEWQAIKPQKIFRCNNIEKELENFETSSFWLKPFECMTLKIIITEIIY
ncbi:MAG: glycosyl hydrolase-related protein [Dysgonamonadaceae bacterium]|jgi:hypothetical protein|nr:glycosyl hydrolase-related protein [Dysgonamonadaceae bacterium]